MLSTIARAAIRRVGAGAVRPSTDRVYQSIWHATHLRNPENQEFSRVPQRTLATATTTSGAGSAKTKKKAPAKKKAAKKPKKVAAKKKAAKPKKVLSPEAKAKLRLKLLKAAALSPPSQLPATSWAVMVKDTLGGQTGSKVTVAIQEVSAKYKSLSPSELEQLNHKANQNKTANETAYKQWIHTYTPEEIRVANNARTQLKKLTSKRYTQLHDDRAPKKDRGPLSLFTQDRWASGDLKGLKIAEAAKLLSREFSELPASEKQAYKARADADKERYAREFKATFNRDPGFVQQKSSP